MPDIALHNSTKQQLELFIEHPTHAVALGGPAGSGKTTLAYWLVAKLLKSSVEKLETYPYLQVISPEGTSISIEAIRQLNNFLKLKTLGKESLRRFIIIEHADKLTIEAQNALLKSLEEPPSDTLIILTLENDKTVLPTVISRLQFIAVHVPSKAELRALFKDVEDPKFNQAYSLSGGLPGLTHALLTNSSEHLLTNAVEQAKQLLQAQSTFERLQFTDELVKHKENAIALLQALKRISVTSLSQEAHKNNLKALGRWQQILTATQRAEDALLRGAQTKLVLTNLMLSL
jgi:DNA polymerase-3 subunit delta'